MSEPLDLNKADVAAIDVVPALKGHGFELVRYHEERGRFTALRQVDEVPGMAGKAVGLEVSFASAEVGGVLSSDGGGQAPPGQPGRLHPRGQQPVAACAEPQRAIPKRAGARVAPARA